MKKISLVLVAITTLLWTSCTYDADTCSTANTTYSGTITSIFTTNGCYSCHGDIPSNGAPFSLVGYSNVVAQKSRLVGAISHANGFAPMPQGLPKLSECDINKVKAWMQAGTPDN
jgi:hypothetical protein